MYAEFQAAPLAFLDSLRRALKTFPLNVQQEGRTIFRRSILCNLANETERTATEPASFGVTLAYPQEDKVVLFSGGWKFIAGEKSYWAFAVENAQQLSEDACAIAAALAIIACAEHLLPLNSMSEETQKKLLAFARETVGPEDTKDLLYLAKIMSKTSAVKPAKETTDIIPRKRRLLVPPPPSAREETPPAEPTPIETKALSGKTLSIGEIIAQKLNRRVRPPELEGLLRIQRIWSNQKQRTISLTAGALADMKIKDARGKEIVYLPEVYFNMPDLEVPVDSPLTLARYIVYYAKEKNFIIPEYLDALASEEDLQQIRKAIKRRNRGKEIEEWTGQLENQLKDSFVKTTPRFPPEIRLRIKDAALDWESRNEPNAPWVSVSPSTVREWHRAAESNLIPPTVSPIIAQLLVQNIILYLSDNHIADFTKKQFQDIETHRFSQWRTQQLLRWLAISPERLALLANKDGEAFNPELIPVKWHAVPADDSDDVRFELRAPDGTPVDPDSLRPLTMLRTPPFIAFAPNRNIYLCPPPFLKKTQDKVSYMSKIPDIPREALSTHTGMKFLRTFGVNTSSVESLPELRVVPLVPTFEIWILPTGTAPGQGAWFGLKLTAVAEGSSYFRRHAEFAWVSLGRAPQPASAAGSKNVIYDYDESALPAADHHLRTLGTSWEAYLKHYARKFPKNFAMQLHEWLVEATKLGFALKLTPELESLARPPDTAVLEMNLESEMEDYENESSGIDWFDIKVALNTGDTTFTPAEIKLLLRAQGDFVNLGEKGWRRLLVTIPDATRSALDALGLKSEEFLEAGDTHRVHALQLTDSRIAGLLPAEHAKRIRERVAALHAIEPPAVPASLQATLRPYQIEGFHFLAHLSENHLGGILADDMGLGKTVQTIAWLLWLRDHLSREHPHSAADAPAAPEATPATAEAALQKPHALRALVICPKSVVANWQIETQRFAPSLTIGALNPAAPVGGGTHVTVLNYAQLRGNATELQNVLWDAVILDEAQYIKNPASQTARIARDLRARARLILTGTPIENRVLDLWSLFSFAMPGLLGTQASFNRHYNDKTDPLARSRLATRTRNFMLRRTKSQVAQDLPPRIEKDLLVDLDGHQRALYDAEVKRARLELLNIQTTSDFNVARFTILQSLLRLRQICCHPGLIGVEDVGDEGGDADAASASGSAKLDALFDQLEPIIEEGHRVLIFSQFVSMLDIIHCELEQRGIEHLILTGQTENRQKLVSEFQSEDGPPVFLLSLKAAGTGLNLTAASYVVLFDPWWNPAVEAQAIDRTHRIGQTEQVIAIRLIARNTVEEKIRQLQNQKAELARDIVREETLATVLNLDDLRFVLS